jgi:GTPase SAR1 family protein
MIRCTHCGAENSATSEFCNSCNAFLAWDAEARAAEPVAQTLAALEVNARVAEPVQQTMAALDATARVAAEEGRDDLEQHLRATREQLTELPVPVVVVGEFKRGKSTLINALLQRAVCPVDADLVTAVPTTVRWADQPRLTAYSRSNGREQLVERSAPLEELELLVTEQADPNDPERERFVEVGLPHRMLRTGLRLVDSPGVGGLDSAHGFLTLGALRQASGVLFVTDAAQELTAPELEFLTTTVQRCPRTALVITKIDLYREWRRIADLDRGHLARAGLDLPVITVSSFLRLRAARDASLNSESGFTELVRFLARDVVAASRSDSARTAAGEVEFVADHLAAQSEAERVVLSEPEQADRTVERLDEARQRATRLISPTATWQQMLADGIGDLVSDIEHDLTQRLRAVLHDSEEVINSNDPLHAWTDTEVWLRRQAAMVAMTNRDLLTERARQLADQVAEQFDMQAGDVDLRLAEPDGSLDEIALAPAESLKMPGGKLAPLMMAARSSFYLPMMAGSVAAAVLEVGPVVHLSIAGLSAALGAGIGRKIITDERARQLTYRRQQALAAVRKFLDEVAFVLNKQTRDGLRATQRQLRDDFSERALVMQRSATEALERAYRARDLDPDRRQARTRELIETEHAVERIRNTARALVAGGV